MMERLSDKATIILNDLHTERLDYDSEYLPLIDAVQRLAYYEDVEEQGRLITLPCKVGDAVYGCFPRYSREAIECKVVKIRACQFGDGAIRHIVDVEFNVINPYYDDGRLMLHGHQAVVADRFGNWDRAFLTREEAEQALGGAEG